MYECKQRRISIPQGVLCYYDVSLSIHRQVNRVTPSGNGDVEKGQRSPGGGVVSTSPSVDSVGLYNFGRSPTEVSPCHYYRQLPLYTVPSHSLAI